MSLLIVGAQLTFVEQINKHCDFFYHVGVDYRIFCLLLIDERSYLFGFWW